MIQRLSVTGTERPRRYDIDRIHIDRVWIKGYPYNVKFMKGQLIVVPVNSQREVVIPVANIVAATAEVF